jgi:hypothetical protein
MEKQNPIEELLKAEEAMAEEFQRMSATSSARIEAFRKSLQALNGTWTPEIERAINDKIRKEEDILQRLQIQLVATNARASAYRDALKVMAGSANGSVRDLRAGSVLAQIRDVLRKVGKNLTLNQILEAQGKADDKGAFRSLRGTLTQYAKAGRVFTKDEVTGTYGLLEFQKKAPEKVENVSS